MDLADIESRLDDLLLHGDIQSTSTQRSLNNLCERVWTIEDSDEVCTVTLAQRYSFIGKRTNGFRLLQKNFAFEISPAVIVAFQNNDTEVLKNTQIGRLIQLAHTLAQATKLSALLESAGQNERQIVAVLTSKKLLDAATIIRRERPGANHAERKLKPTVFYSVGFNLPK